MPLTNSVFIFLTIFIIVGLLETVLLAFWVPFYMRLGIPVWWQRTQVLSKEKFCQAAARLDGTGLAGKWYPTIIFKRISQNELAFRHKRRESKAGFRFRSPIRGMVRLSAEAYTVTVINYLPWTTPVAIFLFLWLFSNFNRPEFNDTRGIVFLVFLLSIVAVTFGLQLVVFRQISDRILEQIKGRDYME
jgi:hypothetical protein